MRLIHEPFFHIPTDRGAAAVDRLTRLDEIVETIILSRREGRLVAFENLINSNPELEPELSERLHDLPRIEAAERFARSTAGDLTTEPGDDVDETPSWLAEALPRYRLHERIAHGGQAVVYRATQIGAGRDVAIKLMRESLFPGAQDQKRFHREIRALGRVRHPNIVTIHDSGIAGRCPYYVMEYISGTPLDEFVRSQALSVPDCLGLFIKLCRAVHAAHLLGVIHRDLKPRNIITDSNGEPHVLDFGLAKLIASETEDAVPSKQMTMAGQFIGTVCWASPEQAAGDADVVDLRTDVYALGLILFQMLTDRLPYSVSGGLHAVLGRIREAEPARPSSISSRIDEDVDSIVLKCLEKDPARRYQSALAVGEDVERFLDGQPILARSPSAVYQLKKLVRRHLRVFALLALLVSVSTGSAVSLGILYSRSNLDRNRAIDAEAIAERRRADAEAAADAALFTRRFLIADVIGATHPWTDGGADVTVVEALNRAAARLTKSPPRDLRTRAELNYTIGSAYVSRAQFDVACRYLSDAVDSYLKLPNPAAESLIQARRALSEALFRSGEVERAEELAAMNHMAATEMLGEGSPTTIQALSEYAAIRWRIRPDSDSAALIESAAARSLEFLGPDHPATINAGYAVASWVRVWQGRDVEAVAALRDLLNVYLRDHGEESHQVLGVELQLGALLHGLGNFAEAEPYLLKTHDRFESVLGEDRGETIEAKIRLAILRRSQQRLREAAELLERAAAAEEREFGIDHPRHHSSIQYLASVYSRQGRLCSAGPMQEQLLEDRRRTLGPDHHLTCTAEVGLAATYHTLGRFPEAEKLARHAVPCFESLEGSAGIGTLGAKLWLARILVAMDRNGEAHPLAEEVILGRKNRADRPDATVADIVYFARELLTIVPESLQNAESALEYLEATQCDDPSDATQIDYYIAVASAQLGDYVRAITLMEQILLAAPLEHSRDRDKQVDLLVEWYRAVGDPESAVAVLRETHDERERVYSAEHPDTLRSRLRLAESLMDGGSLGEVVSVLGDCADFEETPADCAAWQGAKCRLLQAIVRNHLDEPHVAGQSTLDAYQDLLADPWVPATEREKAEGWVAKSQRITSPH